MAGALLVQCSAGDVSAIRVLADRPGSGLVLCGARALERAVELRRDGFTAPLLYDAERYKGNRRWLAAAPFSHGLLDQQRHLRLVALTDSGYVDAGDHAGLAAILDRAARCEPPVVATLPLHLAWLVDPAELDRLIDEIRDHRVTVALVLEDTADPLGRRQVLDGLLRVLRCGVPAVLLRSDIGAVGALAHGARAAAIGVRSAQRHLYPRTEKSGYVPPGPPSALIAQCLAFRRVDALAEGVQLDPDDRMWLCECATCRGRTVDWLATVPGDEGHRLAGAHSIEVALALRDHVLRGGLADAAASWWALCDQALNRFEELAELSWRPPSALRAWRRVGPAGVPT